MHARGFRQGVVPEVSYLSLLVEQVLLDTRSASLLGIRSSGKRTPASRRDMEVDYPLRSPFSSIA